MHGEVRQERFDLGFSGEDLGTRPHAVETGKPYDPLHIGTLGVDRVVVETEHPPDLIEECRLWTSLRVRHRRSLYWCSQIIDNT